MCVFGVVFFVFLLAYNNGEIRWYYFAVNLAAFLTYYYTLHKFFGNRLCALAKNINNSVKNSAKKLKIGKKVSKNYCIYINNYIIMYISCRKAVHYEKVI